MVDPLATKYYNYSVYNYCLNNPIKYVDPDGRLVIKYYDNNGNYLGKDGNNDYQRVVVTDKKEQKSIKKTDKNGGVTESSSVNSGYSLPSDVVLQESLNVLGRTERNGGRSEESSIVTDKSGVTVGEKGPEYKDGDTVLEGTLPSVPNGETVEATIHSHMLVTYVNSEGETAYSAANELGPKDLNTFNEYGARENVIVGRTDAPNPATQNRDGTYSAGAMAPLGVAFYGANSSKPKLILTKKALSKILDNN